MTRMTDNKDNVAKELLLDELKALMDNFFYSIKRKFHCNKGDYPVAEGQFFLMFILWEHGRYKVTDISHRLGITAGAVTAMTDKLVEMGFIRRERSEEDRRIVWLSLTEKGRQVVKKVQDSRFEQIRNIFRNLSEDELQMVTNVFTMLNAKLNDDKN